MLKKTIKDESIFQASWKVVETMSVSDNDISQDVFTIFVMAWVGNETELLWLLSTTPQFDANNIHSKQCSKMRQM